MSAPLRSNYKNCRKTEGETWISWQELQALDFTEIHRRTGKAVPQPWWILFEILALFARHYGDDNVRLVAWWAK